MRRSWKRELLGVEEPAPEVAGVGRRHRSAREASRGGKRVRGLRASPVAVDRRNWWRGLVSPPTSGSAMIVHARKCSGRAGAEDDVER